MIKDFLVDFFLRPKYTGLEAAGVGMVTAGLATGELGWLGFILILFITVILNLTLTSWLVKK